MSPWLLPLISLAYIALLFAVAWWGDKRKPQLGPAAQGILYSLTLAVYCSSWTLYGAVGAGITGGLAYLPIYLGPLLFIWFARPLLARLVLSSKTQSITSISDFIAARYGKAQHLAALVAIIALISALPYIALQLKAVSMSVDVLSRAGLGNAFPTQDTAFWTGLFLAALAILFGTRHIDATEHHQGLMLAVALESIVKLIALVAVALFAWFSLQSLPTEWASDHRLDNLFRPDQLPSGFLAQTLLAFLAIICLPRQFHVAVVECDDVRATHKAPIWFGLYLIIVACAVIPIAALALLQPDINFHPDTALLVLPLAAGHESLAMLAFIGGLSAAAGMVIVASVALSIMVCNDLVVPLLMRYRGFGSKPVPKRLLLIRRLAIIAIIALSYGYYQLIMEFSQLASVGLLAFSAVAQFAPALIGGLLWRGGSRQGVIAGLIAGFIVWLYTLMLPAMLPAMGYHSDWLTHGLFGQAWLKPQELFYLSGWDALTHGVFWSLLINVGLFIVLSLRLRPSMQEQLQAGKFLDPYNISTEEPANLDSQRLNLEELQDLAARILGQTAAREAFEQFARGRMQQLDLRAPASRTWVQFVERLLASAMGTASARALLTSALRGTGLEIGQVVDLLDQTSQQQRFNRDVLSTMMEHIEQGISVVDADMRLVAWNSRYLELFDYPPGMVYEGCPIADLIRYNAEQGECGPGEIEDHVRRRVQHLRDGKPHHMERIRPDGQVLEMRGRPIAGGGFVTTFADITHFKEVERTLADRVAQRTKESELARQQAEHANLSKTRFLAAASHDLLQPMNAARLFSSALNQFPSLDKEASTLAKQLDSSLRGAEELLSALLDISRLDAGALNPNLGPINLSSLIQELCAQVEPVAQQRQLHLRVRLPTTAAWVISDKQWLRRIVQNLLSNALRYTRTGSVLVAIRWRKNRWQVEVRDTGPGIPEGKIKHIFEEFQRGGESSPWGEKGMGLGLAIVDRMARILGHDIAVRSSSGRGACFSLNLERTEAAIGQHLESTNDSALQTSELNGLRVLCIDNEPAILAGMQALLSRWGCIVSLAGTGHEAEQALTSSNAQVILSDYHLANDEDGLALLIRLAKGRVGALVTADHSDEVALAVKQAGLGLLRKPLKPAALRAFLSANL